MIDPSILYYCKYQERCHKEVRNKLYELGLTSGGVEQQIAELIQEGVLNEERFAIAFTRGKFRMLQWGRVKIRQQLKLRGISDYCIRKAQREIDEEEYCRTLMKLAENKLALLISGKIAVKKVKTYRFLVQKGYEGDLVTDIIKQALEKKLCKTE